jgi:voltage-gated sodium channel
MLQKLFLSNKFILGLIIINAFILFLGGYLNSEKHYYAFLIADNLLTTLFIFELVVKLKEFGLKNYFSSNWNRLDFVLIILSIPALISFILNVDIYDISFLLVFRVLRVFKVFRFFKFIPDVEQLISGIKRALKASVFALFGFLIYLFIVGILSFYLFQNSNTEFFTNPTVSFYSIFKIFTIEGWFEIPELLAENQPGSVSIFIFLYFILVVITGGIVGLSLVNSIFVDSMLSDNSDELEKKIDSLDTKITEILYKLKDHET